MRILLGIIIGAAIAVTWPEHAQQAHLVAREQIHNLSTTIAQRTQEDTIIITIPWSEK